jgi:O-antigen ligase
LSQLVAISEVRAVAGELRRWQVIDAARAGAFVGALLLAWVSLRPFVDLGEVQLNDSTGHETLTYVAFGCLAVLTIALAMRDSMRGLLTLLSPAYILFGGWIFATVVLSLDPGTSIRRFAAMVCVTAVAATLMLLPKTQDELARWVSIAALALLAICYLGLLLAPNLSMHMATDAQEPALAGNWRGSFGHKNVAAAMMAMLLFLGIYIVRSGAWLSGIAIIGLSSLFLQYSAGKSSLALCFAVLALTSLTTVVRSFWLRAVMLLAPLLLANLLSVGTVMSEGLAEIAKMLPLDSSFTGRHRRLDLCGAGPAAAVADRIRF